MTAPLVLLYVADDEIKKTKYHDVLRDDIRDFVSISGCKNLNDMIERARDLDIELETWSNRKPEHV